MNIHKIISDRWSPLSFSERTVESEALSALFEAARWAPSSYNAQPWKFIWGAKGDAVFPLLFDLIAESNQVWARTAPVLILSFCELIQEGRNSENRFAAYDTGMAVGNMLAQATATGLYIHQMGGYDVQRAKKVLNVPENLKPMAMMALGYRGDPSALSDDLIQREGKERHRKDLNSFVFNSTF